MVIQYILQFLPRDGTLYWVNRRLRYAIFQKTFQDMKRCRRFKAPGSSSIAKFVGVESFI